MLKSRQINPKKTQIVEIAEASTTKGKETSLKEGDRIKRSILTLEVLDMLLKLIDLASEIRDSEEEPVEDEGGGDEKSVALALHDRFLVPQVLGRRAGVLLIARRPGLVLPVDIHEQEEAEGDD